ncbi:hypothetical protein AB0I72_25860 [Nocardiopsis sp. NPDC049922]|uniref:GHMP family kinase ATP-binding protein n=1 Tax=Nocardiopsis sp. NPDC049922 TaxID=3155157 RepID=UPI0033E3660A
MSARGSGTGRAFGTFGELLQGALPPDGRDFLVTLPIARWSVACFRAEPGSTLRVVPEEKTRSRSMAARVLEMAGVRTGGVLTLDTALPTGKGMASSSADLVATVRAVGDAYGLRISGRGVEDLLRDIEPTDGVMYDAVVVFHHRDVRLRSWLGSPPPMTIVGMDEGGTVDTLEFNRTLKRYSFDDLREYQRLLCETELAMRAGAPRRLGAVATRSAVLNQRLSPNRLLDDALAISQETGALGVVTAHSGTRIGILLDDADPEYGTRLLRVREACQELSGEVTIDHALTFDGRRWDPAAAHAYTTTGGR